MARAAKSPLERLQEKIRTADRGWFFAAVAEKVAERRQAKGLSQRELAELVGTTQSAIARLESAEPKHSPSIATLQKYAKALGYTVQVKLVKERRLTTRSSGPGKVSGRTGAHGK